MIKIKKIYIKGMHCSSCEKLLDSEFRNILGVKDVKVNRKTDSAEIFYEDEEPNFSEIRNTAKKFGYDTEENDSKKFNPKEWGKAILIVVAIIFLYNIFKSFGIIDKIDFKSTNVTYGISFLIGLVASISSCLVVVGAVIIAFGEKYKSNGGSFFNSAVKPNLFFHIGRLITFFALGGVLGLIGKEINISGNFISIFTMVIAFVMAWLGLNILGVLPSISNMGVRMPNSFTKNWDKLKKSEHKAAPFILGGLSFFLPCGFTQSMQIFALTSGSFLTGGISLFLFALGTAPSLLALGITASWTKYKKMTAFQKAAGIIILIFAVYTFNSGLALKGIKNNILTSGDKNQTDYTVDNNNEQVIKMSINYNGFEPNILRIKKNVPVKWVINGEQISGCSNRIIIPSLNMVKKISYGENIVRFTPNESGEIPFSCWMGMIRGKFIVE